MRHRAPVVAIVVALLSPLLATPAMAADSSTPTGLASTVDSSVSAVDSSISTASTHWSANPDYAKGKAYFLNIYGDAYIANNQAVYYLDRLTLSTESTATQTAYFNVYDVDTGRRLWPNDSSGSGAGYSVDWRGKTQNTVDAWFKLPATHRLSVTYSTTEGAHGKMTLTI